jgi:hypothetical protein
MSEDYVVDTQSKYIVLEGIEKGNTFFSINSSDESVDPRVTLDGKISYNIIGYANTGDEARGLITAYTGKSDNHRVFDYIRKTQKEMSYRQFGTDEVLYD